MQKTLDVFEQVDIEAIKKNKLTEDSQSGIEEEGSLFGEKPKQQEMFKGGTKQSKQKKAHKQKTDPNQGDLFTGMPPKATQIDLFDADSGGLEKTGNSKNQSKSTRQVETGVRDSGYIKSHGLKVINHPEVASLFTHLIRDAQENVYTVTVDKNDNVLEVHEYSRGSKNSGTLDATEVAGRVFRVPGADKVYFIHNHPAGSTESSPSDRESFRQIQKILKLKKITIADGIIIGKIGNTPSYGTFGKHGDFTAPKEIPALESNTEIKTKRRYIKKDDPQDPITDPYQAEAYLKDKPSGFLMLDTKGKVSGFLEFTQGQKSKDLTADIIKETEATNSPSIIIYNNDPGHKKRYEHFIRLAESLRTVGVLTHDIIQKTKDGRFDHKQLPDLRYLKEKEKKELLEQWEQEWENIDSDKPVFQTNTDQLPGQGVDLKTIQKLFKNQQVFISPDKAISIRLKNGQGVRILSTKQMSKGDVQYAIESGRMGKDGIILGKTEGNTITLNQDYANKQTLPHELFHTMENLGIINKLDLKVLDNQLKKFQEAGTLTFKLNKSKNKSLARDENRAGIFAQLLVNREQYRDTAIGRVIQKIADFLDAIVYIGRQSARKLARQVESGEIYNRGSKESDFKAAPQFQVDRKSADKYRDQLKAYLSNPTNYRRPVTIGRTPYVLQLTGVSDARITINPSVLRKVLTELKHDLPNDIAKQLPEQLANLIAIFNTEKSFDSRVVLTELQHNNNSIVIAVHLNKKDASGVRTIHKIASVHKRRDSQLNKWIEKDLLLYLNTEKAKGQSHITDGLQLPKGETNLANKNILTQKDVVKKNFQTAPNISTNPDIRYQTSDDQLTEQGRQEVEKIMSYLQKSSKKMAIKVSRSKTEKLAEKYVKIKQQHRDETVSLEQKIKDYRDFLSGMPMHVRGKAMAGMVKVSRAKTKKTREKYFYQAVDQARKHLNKYFTSLEKAKLHRLRKRPKQTKGGEIKKSLLGPETQMFLDILNNKVLKWVKHKGYKFGSTQARDLQIKHLQDQLKTMPAEPSVAEQGRIEEIETEIEALQLFGGIDEMSLTEVEDARASLQQVIDNGRTAWSNAEEARKKDIAMTASKGMQEITGEKEPVPETAGEEEVRQRKAKTLRKKFTQTLSNIDTVHQSWRMLMDKVFTKSGKDPLESVTGKKLSSLVHQATNSEDVIGRHLSSMVTKKVIELSGLKKPRPIARWLKNQSKLFPIPTATNFSGNL